MAGLVAALERNKESVQSIKSTALSTADASGGAELLFEQFSRLLEEIAGRFAALSGMENEAPAPITVPSQTPSPAPYKSSAPQNLKDTPSDNQASEEDNREKLNEGHEPKLAEADSDPAQSSAEDCQVRREQGFESSAPLQSDGRCQAVSQSVSAAGAEQVLPMKREKDAASDGSLANLENGQAFLGESAELNGAQTAFANSVSLDTQNSGPKITPQVLSKEINTDDSPEAPVQVEEFEALESKVIDPTAKNALKHSGLSAEDSARLKGSVALEGQVNPALEEVVVRRLSDSLNQRAASNTLESTITEKAVVLVEVESGLPGAMLQTPAATADSRALSSVEYQLFIAQQVLRPLLEVDLQKAADVKSAQLSSRGAVSAVIQLVEGGVVKSEAPALAGDAARRAQALPRLVANNTLEKVEAVLKEAARLRDGSSISLRLDPPSLGSLKVDVTLRDGCLHARLAADSPQVSMLLREKAHDLQVSLRRLGLDVEQVSVSVNSDGVAADSQDTAFGREETQRGQRSEGWKEEGDDGLEGRNLKPAHTCEMVLDHWVA